MDTDFSGLAIGRLPSIVNKCLKLKLVTEEQVKTKEASYTKGSGAVSLFHYFNSKLPPSEQLKFGCSSPIVDSFISFTEESLSLLFPIINGKKSKDLLKNKGWLIKELFGLDHGHKKLCLLSEKEKKENVFATRVLGGSIQTDGYELQFHAIDLNTIKKKTIQSESIQKAKTYKSSDLPDNVRENISSYTLAGIDVGKINALMATIYRPSKPAEKVLYGFKT